MKSDLPTIQMVIAVFEEERRPLSKGEVIHIVRQRFSVRTVDATIMNCLRNLSVNDQGRTAWHKKEREAGTHHYDRLYHNTAEGTWELYDRPRHGSWQIRIIDAKPAVCRSSDGVGGASRPQSEIRNTHSNRQRSESEGRESPSRPSVLTTATMPNGDSFEKLETDIRACKCARRCVARPVRQYYFENEQTASDCPVMFICHCPATRTGARDGSVRETCWNATAEDFHFNALRREFTFVNAYITNSIKCGTTVASPDTDEECSRCSVFLAREIALVNPKRIITVGAKADRITRRFTESSDRIISVPHYSWRRRPNYDPEKERAAYSDAATLLRRMVKRGLPVSHEESRLQ